MVPHSAWKSLPAGARFAASVPLLVIVSGAPGAGKSTLAERLGAALGLPVFTKDGIKEALLDSLGASTRARSRELGGASYAVLSVVAETLLASGSSVVMESNFHHGTSEPELRRLLVHGRGVQVHCATSRDVIERRYRARFEAGLRHPGHFDIEALPDVLKGFDEGVCEALDLDVPLVRVETTDGYRPGFENIVEQVRRV
jgi:predicted kinase